MAVVTKDSLRLSILNQRRDMPEEERTALSARIAENFFKHVTLPPKDKIVSAYFPVNGEVDVLPIVRKLISLGYTCTLPHVLDKDSRIAFLKWDDTTKMQNTSIFGIPEPHAKAPEFIPDFMLMPLIAFDEKGNRLGYGSGNFDRTFAYLKKIQGFTTIAIAYERQKVPFVPTDMHDYPMDMAVTEERFYDFKGTRV